MSTSQPGPVIWGLLVLLGLLWGASFPAVSVALGGFGPFTIVALRVSLAAVTLLILAFGLGYGLPGVRSPTERRIWLHAAGVAIFFNAMPFTLLSWGQKYVTSGYAGITMAVVPLFVLPLAHFMVPGDTMSRRKVIGFVLGFAGVVVLIGPDAFTSSGAEVENLARLACLLATAGYAIANIITRLAPPCPQLSFSAAALSIASLIMLPLALLIEGLPEAPGTAPVLAVIYLGLGPTALATLILVRIITTVGSTFLVLVNYQVPIWAALMGVFFLSENLPPQFIAALGLILLGLAVSQPRRRRRVSP
ncbi:MAG: DMT family transporter [Rhodobacteraceae bacterium]|nr:DMT family transporter [Paracoccaceae bacterium]